ncbi:MAG: type I phosphomannose isomerase catalytic subunit [Phycisphaerae bacterium]
MNIYPLKFLPVFQERIWGGQKIRQTLGRPVPRDLYKRRIGESWELADLPAGSVQVDSVGAAADGSLSSRVANGALAKQSLHEVLAQWGEAFMGRYATSHKHFPLFIKFLDAAADLSVQVHPNRAYVATHSGAYLKSEAWYVLEAAPGAKIYKGVKPGVTRDMFAAALQAGAVDRLLQAVPVQAGDCHFVESGTVHALGAGVLVAEVQTPSDTTFRVFDWNRLAPNGKARTLHIQEALEVINFAAPISVPPPRRNYVVDDTVVTELVSCDYFSMDRLTIPDGSETLPPDWLADKPEVWICLSGQGVLETLDAGVQGLAFAPGETILIPATARQLRLRVVSACTLLRVRLP